MSYCTVADVDLHAPAILNDTSAAARVADGIVVAQSKIDGRLQSKFVVPFPDPVPSLIRTVAVCLASAWAMKGAYNETSSEQIHWAESQEKEGMTLLGEILAGTMKLEDASTLEVMPAQTPPIAIHGYPDYQIRAFDPLGNYGPKLPGRPGRYPGTWVDSGSTFGGP